MPYDIVRRRPAVRQIDSYVGLVQLLLLGRRAVCECAFILSNSVLMYVCIMCVYMHTVFQKQPLCFLVISSASISRFSKFFHRQIPKKTFWIAVIAISTSP